MKIKIYYRSPVVWNLILFVIFSFAFLILQEVYISLASILDKKLVLQFLEDRAWFLALAAVTMLFVYNLKASSKWLLMAVTLSTFVLTCINLNQEFSKMILIILFFYLLIAYYLVQFYKMERSESFYNPKYSEEDLFSPMLLKFECLLRDKKQELKHSGILTNWSEEGCFVKLDESVLLGNHLVLSVQYQGHQFEQNCLLAAKNYQADGYGLKFLGQENNPDSSIMGWKEFNTIIEQMGYEPELLI